MFEGIYCDRKMTAAADFNENAFFKGAKEPKQQVALLPLPIVSQLAATSMWKLSV